MNKKVYIGIIILVLLILPLVASLQTELIIKADPEDKIVVRALDPATNKILQNFDLIADTNGEVSTYFSIEAPDVWFKVMLVDRNGKVVRIKYFKEEYSKAYVTGDPVVLEFVEQDLSEDYLNENVNNTELIEEEGEEISGDNKTKNLISDSLISGSAVSDLKNFFSKNKYYLFGALFFVVIAFIVVFVFKNKLISLGNSSSKEPGKYDNKYVKLTPKKPEKDITQGIEEAEKRIKSAEEEINKLKSREKVLDAERKLEDDRAELEKLRREGGE